MHAISDIDALRATLTPWRRSGERIALVPTMGHLHQGHISLLEEARKRSDRLVASIYVNPAQFDRPDDLSAYPRTLERDLEQLQAAGVDLVFTPDDSVIYPGGHGGKTQIDIPGMTNILCGKHRPGHFVGVATIVCKLFNLVQPDVAVFGEKDFQQLMVVRRMTDDLNLPVEIVGAPTWREHSGLAMSSRNSYLNAGEFAQASRIYQVMCRVAEQLIDGAANVAELEADASQALLESGFKPDYVTVRRCADLAVPGPDDSASDLVVLVAAFLGQARLIDNLQVAHYLRDGNVVNLSTDSSSSASRSH